MKITIEEIDSDIEEEIILRCHEIDVDMVRLLKQISNVNQGLVGYKGEEIHRLFMDDVYYFEVVDNKSFLYCKDEVYESKLKLYEFEELCRGTNLFRASKSMIINSSKIDYVSPSFSGRFEVSFFNKEKVIVSRQYVNELKKRIGL